jgi:hypothetical protein
MQEEAAPNNTNLDLRYTLVQGYGARHKERIHIIHESRLRFSRNPFGFNAK